MYIEWLNSKTGENGERKVSEQCELFRTSAKVPTLFRARYFYSQLILRIIETFPFHFRLTTGARKMVGLSATWVVVDRKG